jgi:hypothetical protein
MPTQLPLEATVYFGSKLLPLIPQIIEVDAKKDFQMQNIPRDIRDVNKSNIESGLSYPFLAFIYL